MAPARRVYTDEDRAQGLLHLTLTDGNVKRAARDSGFPESTIRRWKQEWEREGVPAPVQQIAEQEADSFTDDAIRVRGKALKAIEQKLPDAKVSELITTVGVLDDKIMRAKGLATSRTVVQHELPSPDEIRATLVAAMTGALEAARERHEIIDAEVVEPARPALPPGR